MKTIETTDRAAMAIFRRAFPETNFRAITVREFRGPMSLNSYWSEGYRDFFVVLPMDGSKVVPIPQNGTPFDARNLELSELPEGFAVAVRHYQGSRQRGSLYLRAENITQMLPEPSVVCPWIEIAVLACICSLKSFARREQAARLGIGAAEYDATVEVLKSKRLLTANGGASPEGRNFDSANCGSLQWNWGKLAQAGGRDCEEKRSADRMAAQYANVTL